MSAVPSTLQFHALGGTVTDVDDIRAVCADFGNDRHRMMDILLAIQSRCRWISPATLSVVAEATGLARIDVEGVASFYSFLSLEPKGRFTIHLCDDIVDRYQGFDEVLSAFERALSIGVGETTADGRFSLDLTPCIGLCDQAPAAMINEVVFTRLTPARVRDILDALAAGTSPGELIAPAFEALSPVARARAMVEGGIRHRGEVLLCEVPAEAGLQRAIELSPEAIIDTITSSGLRGCGGAGFATGLKWQFARAEDDPERHVFCNADEGEPGTFKDRVLLTERPHLMIEGMSIAARAIGATQGLIYLRGEYAWLKPTIEQVLTDRRQRGLLGTGILGVDGFDFDIRVQLGAGAYICGEEGALISSAEGLPGEPKTRPPFPVNKGYLGHPTVVNNVETFCHAARILDRGASWFHAMGGDGSHGSKLFSVSGDCTRPGVYEYPYGLSVQELLDAVGADDAAAVLVGGPSGTMIGRDQFHRKLTFDDLPTGGAVVVFNGSRNILEIVEYYLSFFVHESCGYCTPCRVGNVFLQKAIARFRRGQANPADIDYLKSLSATIIETSRCGLGMTSPNPVLSTLKHFPLVYAASVKPPSEGVRATFDIQAAIDNARRLAHRRSTIYDEDYSQ